MGEFSTHVSAPNLYKNLPYDPVRDFSPITMVMKSPLLLVANPAVPATSLRELVGYAKTRPGALKYASQSVRSSGNLTMKLFLRAAGVNMLHVPYKRAADSLTAVMSHEVDVSFLGAPVSLPLFRSGKVKLFAVSSAKRFADAPEIPTVAESGISGFETGLWSAVFAPARTPPALVARLNREMTEILRSPNTQSAFLAQGAEVAPTTPQELASFVKTEIAKWAHVIKEAGITPE
jgi:tripartite-type tricarboxylate transporter receptor subunit TctC